MNDVVYIQSKKKVSLPINQPVLLVDLIEIYARNDDLRKAIENIGYIIKNQGTNQTYLIAMFSIISLINHQYPNADLNVLGEPDILLSFQKKETLENQKSKLLRVTLVCFILFVSAATAIINFHSDVDMPETHKIIYEIITGKETDNLLLLQIPYSIGIGTGMSVFFNHIFKRRINNEPSPLEVEVHLYQENLDQYIKDKTDQHNR